MPIRPTLQNTVSFFIAAIFMLGSLGELNAQVQPPTGDRPTEEQPPTGERPPTAETPPTLAELQQQLEAQAERIRQLEQDAGSDDDLYEGITTRLSAVEASTQEIQSLDLENVFLENPTPMSLRSTTGRLHLDYWGYPEETPGINLIETGNANSPPEDRFELRRIRIGIRGSVPPKNVTYQLDLEFSGIEQIGVRDAWIGLDDMPVFHTLRIGNQKRPYGLDHLNSSNFTVFLERPLIIDSVNPQRHLGIQSYGSSDDQTFNWRYGYFELAPIEELGVIASNSYQPELAGRLAMTPWYHHDGRQYLHLGTATSIAFPNDSPTDSRARFRTRPEARSAMRWLDTDIIPGSHSYQLLTAESVLNLGPLQLGGEYVHVWLQRDSSGPDIDLEGGYVYLSYFLTGEHQPWNRKLGVLGRVQPNHDLLCLNCDRHGGIGAWQVAARFSLADLNDQDILGGRGRSATFAVNWYWNAHTRLQFNYIVGRIDDREVNLGGGMFDVVSGDYQIAGTRLMIDY